MMFGINPIAIGYVYSSGFQRVSFSLRIFYPQLSLSAVIISLLNRVKSHSLCSFFCFSRSFLSFKASSRTLSKASSSLFNKTYTISERSLLLSYLLNASLYFPVGWIEIGRKPLLISCWLMIILPVLPFPSEKG